MSTMLPISTLTTDVFRLNSVPTVDSAAEHWVHEQTAERRLKYPINLPSSV